MEIDFRKLGLIQNVVIFLGPIRYPNQERILNLFSVLPYTIIYDVEYFQDEPYNSSQLWMKGYLIYLQLPLCFLNQLLGKISQVSKNFSMIDFDFITDLIEEKPYQYVQDRNVIFLNPFKAHLRDGSIWHRVEYFDHAGQPFSYTERLRQLKESKKIKKS